MDFDRIQQSVARARELARKLNLDLDDLYDARLEGLKRAGIGPGRRTPPSP